MPVNPQNSGSEALQNSGSEALRNACDEAKAILPEDYLRKQNKALRLQLEYYKGFVRATEILNGINTSPY